MKKILFLLLISLVGCGSTTDQPQKNNEIKIVRADVVYDSSTGLTPIIVKLNNDNLIASWQSKGDLLAGCITQFAQSTDKGITWSKLSHEEKSDNSLIGVGVNYQKLTGNKILRYSLEVLWADYPDPTKPNWGSLVGSRKFDSYYSISVDDGKNFSEKILLSDPTNRNDFSQGNIIELPNGDLLWPWGNWGEKPMNGFKRSVDGGLTWGETIRAWQDPPPGFSAPIKFNETAATVCSDGSIVAIARVDIPSFDKRFWQIKSTDNGKTWSVPRQIWPQGGSPAIYCTTKGQLLLAYRDAGISPGVALVASDDNGNSWRYLFHLREPKGEHYSLYGNIKYTEEDRKKAWRPAEGIAGYPCFVKLSDDEVYIVFHAQNSKMAVSYPQYPFYVAGNLLKLPN